LFSCRAYRASISSTLHPPTQCPHRQESDSEKREGGYADSNQCGVIFEAFHVSDTTSFIGREGHDDIPALGHDTDRALGVPEEDVAKRRA
jgi:hypothetical protein